MSKRLKLNKMIFSKINFIKLLCLMTILSTATTIVLVTRKNKTSQPLEKTSIRLKWICQAQFAGYYTAQEKGYFTKAGLDVEIDPAGPNISPTQMVVSGANDFGIAGADEILAARSKGAPIVGIAVFYRQTPEALVSLKTANINTPKDLEGKTVGVIYGNDENIYRLFIQQQGVDSSSIKEVAAIPGNSQILSDSVSAKMAYEMNDAILLKLQNKEVNIMRFRDYGIKFYADTLFTTEKMIKEHPDRVRALVNSSIAGWEDSISDPVAAVNNLMKISPTLNKEHQIGYLKASIPIITQGGKMGMSDVTVWQSMTDILSKNGITNKDLDVHEAFTNDFIN